MGINSQKAIGGVNALCAADSPAHSPGQAVCDWRSLASRRGGADWLVKGADCCQHVTMLTTLATEFRPELLSKLEQSSVSAPTATDALHYINASRPLPLSLLQRPCTKQIRTQLLVR